MSDNDGMTQQERSDEWFALEGYDEHFEHTVKGVMAAGEIGTVWEYMEKYGLDFKAADTRRSKEFADCFRRKRNYE